MSLVQQSENKTLVIYESSLCEELQQKIEKSIQNHIEWRRKAKLLDIMEDEELTIEEYDKIISNLEENFDEITYNKSDSKAGSSEELKKYSQQLILEKIERNKLERKELIDFNNKLIKLRLELENYYTYPVDNLLDEIIRYINSQQQQLIDTIFQEFVGKIMKMCPEDKDYEQTIKSIYIGRQSKKVIDLFGELTNKLINYFTEIIHKIGDNEIFSTNYNNYKELMKLKNSFKNIVSEIYYSTITAEIYYKIEQFPEKEMNNSSLVKSYSQSLLSQLNEFIIHNIPSKIEVQLKYYFTQIYKVKFDSKAGSSDNKVGNKAENKPIIEEKTINKPIIEEIEEIDNSSKDSNDNINQISENKSTTKELKTIDTFIDTLSFELIEVNHLTELFNEYFTKTANAKEIGKILKDNVRINKLIKKLKGKKYTYYQRLE